MTDITDLGLELEKISEEEIAEYIEDLIIQNLKSKIDLSNVEDLDLVITVNKNDTLDIDISAEITLKDKTQQNAQTLLDQAIDETLRTFEEKMRQG